MAGRKHAPRGMFAGSPSGRTQRDRGLAARPDGLLTETTYESAITYMSRAGLAQEALASVNAHVALTFRDGRYSLDTKNSDRPQKRRRWHAGERRLRDRLPVDPALPPPADPPGELSRSPDRRAAERSRPQPDRREPSVIVLHSRHSSGECSGTNLKTSPTLRSLPSGSPT